MDELKRYRTSTGRIFYQDIWGDNTFTDNPDENLTQSNYPTLEDLVREEGSVECIDDLDISNVYLLVTRVLGVAVDSTTADGLAEFPIGSPCGEWSKQIVDRTIELLGLMDPSVRETCNLKESALHAIEIICFG
jgi:hypothetical protein